MSAKHIRTASTWVAGALVSGLLLVATLTSPGGLL